MPMVHRDLDGEESLPTMDDKSWVLEVNEMMVVDSQRWSMLFNNGL